MKDDDRYQKISSLAQSLAKKQKQLMLIRALLTSEAFHPKAELILQYDDGKDRYGGRMYMFEFETLIREQMDLATPILGAAETSIREQIRKLEEQLRELGVK